MRKFVSGKTERRRRTFDNKSLKVIGGMGITCRRGWGAKWNEVENHLRKMRTYVIRRRKKRNEKLLLRRARFLFKIKRKKKWILGVAFSFFLFFFFLEHTYGRVNPSVNRQWVRARMEKMLNDPENIHTQRSYDGGQIRFFMEASSSFSFVLALVLSRIIIIMYVSEKSTYKKQKVRARRTTYSN